MLTSSVFCNLAVKLISGHISHLHHSFSLLAIWFSLNMQNKHSFLTTKTKQMSFIPPTNLHVCNLHYNLHSKTEAVGHVRGFSVTRKRKAF